MKIWNKKLNLYQKFSMVILLLGLLPMLILSTVIMNRMFREYGESLRNNYEQAAGYVNDSIGDMFETYNGIAKMPYYYNYSSEGQFEFNYMSFDNLRQIIYGIGVEPEKVEEIRRNNMRIFLSNVQAVDNSITGTHFIARDLDGNILPFHKSRTGLQNPKDETVFNERMGFGSLDKNSKKFLLIPSHKNDYFPMHDEQVFTVARNYFDLTGVVGNYHYVGTLFLDVSVSRLEEAFRNINLNPEDSVFVCDRDFNCYYSSDADLIGTDLSKKKGILKETEEKFVIETDYNSYGLQVIITMKTRTVYQKLRQMQHMMYLFLGISLAALMCGSLWFSRRLTKPIYHMMDRMSEIETGNFKVELPVTSGDEIGILSKRFNQMSKELENYINQSYVAHMKQAEAEMTALKSQIYPHFLYNTLEVIRMTALEQEDSVVSEMIEALSTQIRYMIGPMQDMVPLEQEVDIIRKYVYLLNCRIKGKVKLVVELNGLGGQGVPKLILQPIVENAFVHGIKPKDGSGNVLISAELSEGLLEISVMDNGVGMDEDALMRLRTLLLGNEPGIKNEHNWQSIGLKNVHDRIRYLFGEGYGIEVTSTPSVGTMVRIIMPWKKGEEEDVSNDSGR
ncbi:sensor histidine kinase [Lacrimispora indolis]|uniref:sensor histidine kinase n=1 Tax=Lacrimispora indolis TaxID=69825 RepID=UPI00040A7D92|nr:MULTISPECIES: histidine kinase [Lachnospiraceae]MBE7722812.1 sensor histidine kinase [Lacrimispora celerecrescens]